jgi:hypothetical protein
MVERNLENLDRRAAEHLAEAIEAARAAEGAEEAVSHLTLGAMQVLVDRGAETRPGNLKPGETQFMVSGTFLLTPDLEQSMLFAEHGFPAEQHRLTIPADLAHPGWVLTHQKALIIPNTETNTNFKQILKTARMGSAMYWPMFWQGRIFGLFITASQARETFQAVDHVWHGAFARAAAVAYMAKGGPNALLAALESKTQ